MVVSGQLHDLVVFTFGQGTTGGYTSVSF